jgi:hypothetical protein
MHFYFIFEAGHQSSECADWIDARRTGLDAADERRSRVVHIAWKAGGESEYWAKTDEQWTQLPEIEVHLVNGEWVPKA